MAEAPSAQDPSSAAAPQPEPAAPSPPSSQSGGDRPGPTDASAAGVAPEAGATGGQDAPPPRPQADARSGRRTGAATDSGPRRAPAPRAATKSSPAAASAQPAPERSRTEPKPTQRRRSPQQATAEGPESAQAAKPARRRSSGGSRSRAGTGARSTGTTRASTSRSTRPRVIPPKPRIPRAGKTILDGLGVPVFGARQGAVERVDWSGLSDEHRLGTMARLLRHRRWVYATAATDRVMVTLAVLDGATMGTAFCMITDLRTGEAVADSSRPGGPRPLVHVGDAPHAGLLATYRLPGTDYRISREPGSSETRIRVSLRRASESLPGLRWVPGIGRVPLIRDLPTASSKPWLDLDLTLESSVAPALTSVSRVAAEGGLLTSTVKTAAMNSWGTVTLHGDDAADAPRTFSLDGGTGGLDYTNGFLPRHTSWRWAYATSRLEDGRMFGMNLVSEFTGIGDEACENCVWLDGALVPIDPQVRVLFDKRDLSRPWTVRTVDGSVHLQFKPLAVHREGVNAGLIRGRLLQPTGRFSGHLMVEGERVVLDGMPGVVEHSDLLW